MSRYPAFGDESSHQPVTWWRGHPVWAAHFIVIVFVGSMLATTLLMAFKAGGVLDWLMFTSDRVLHGQVWRIFTYGFVNPPSLLPFVIDMLMIVWFGREVEKFFGRQKFLTLFAGIYLLTPLLFTLIGVWLPLTRVGATGAFALFIAFATLYPNAAMMFEILAKWAAWVLVGIFSLMALAYHDWAGLISLWATSGFAFAFVRHEQGLLNLPTFRLPARKPKLRVLPDLPAEKPARPTAIREDATMAEVDALLDKIARSGLSSLTAKEREKLETGRENILRKGSSRQ
jgi:hypothetical protein